MLPKAVMITTGTSGSLTLISASSSSPFIPGITRSVTTTSASPRRSRASPPSAAPMVRADALTGVLEGDGEKDARNLFLGMAPDHPLAAHAEGSSPAHGVGRVDGDITCSGRLGVGGLASHALVLGGRNRFRSSP